MRREVSAHFDLTLSGRTKIIFSAAVAEGVPLSSETLSIVVDGRPVEPEVVTDRWGSRLHQVIVDGTRLGYDYRATVADAPATSPATSTLDLVEFLRPSRYCESDALGPTAADAFGTLRGQPLLDAVARFVNEKLYYVAGSSQPTDGALQTLLTRRGVCRDFAHLSTALLRARDVPARVVGVYAPGLSPMEFHAVCEAWVDDAWQVVDATWLAPRRSLVRVATGRDAADTAFITNHWSYVRLEALQITAVADELPTDDWTSPAQLG